jgi:hypothetical protein
MHRAIVDGLNPFVVQRFGGAINVFDHPPWHLVNRSCPATLRIS